MGIKEKVRVFISSAQADEDGFKWTTLRKEIKDHLNTCERIEAFTIEDYASSTPSNQFMLEHVDTSDVIVILIRSTVREGTQQEYERAIGNNKRILLYFINYDSVDESVLRLRKRSIDLDYNLFKDNIKEKDVPFLKETILENILNDVIFSFKATKYWENDTVETITDYDYKLLANGLTPTKESIKLFQSTYSEFFNWVGIKTKEDEQESELHQIGSLLIKWLVSGIPFEYGKPIQELIDISEKYGINKDWLKLRWDAIIAAIRGNYESALSKEAEALETAKTQKLPEWIIHNILIDCRNLKFNISISNNQFQEEIDKSETPIFFPVLDRYLEQIYGNLLKEEFRFSTIDPNTRIIGSSFQTQLSDFLNYYFTASLYGSYTHIYCAREYLFKILYKISRIIDDSRIKYKALQLIVLHGESKRFSSLVKSDWDNLYPHISAEPDVIWTLANNAIEHNNAICLSVIKELGLYFSNKTFKEVEVYLLSIYESKEYNNHESYIDAVLHVSRRLNNNDLLSIVVEIIEQGLFVTGNKLSRLLMTIRTKDADSQLLSRLKNALVLRLDIILERNGSPQLIAALVKENKELFSELYDKASEYFKDDEKALYDLNTGSGNWLEVFNEELNVAKSQFEQNRTPGRFVGFASNPYWVIKDAIRSFSIEDENIASYVNNQLISFATEVFSSDADIAEKGKCLDCLVDAILFVSSCGVDVDSKLKNAITFSQQNIISNDFMGISANAYRWRLRFVQIALGETIFKSIIELLPKYSKMNDRDRIEIAQGLEQLLFFKSYNEKDVDTAFYLTLLLFEDPLPDIRSISLDCLSYLVDTKYAFDIEGLLVKATDDPSHTVRFKLLSIAKKHLKENSISNSIIDVLSNDAHFAIRDFALNDN